MYACIGLSSCRTHGNVIIGTQEIVRDAITRKQAQRVVERYILPDAQQDAAETIEYSLNVLFGSEKEGEP